MYVSWGEFTLKKVKLTKPNKLKAKLVHAYVTAEGSGSKCTNDRCNGTC